MNHLLEQDDQPCTFTPYRPLSGKILNALLMAFSASVFLLGCRNFRSLWKKNRFKKSRYLFLFYLFAQLTSFCKFNFSYQWFYSNDILWTRCIHWDGVLHLECAQILSLFWVLTGRWVFHTSLVRYKESNLFSMRIVFEKNSRVFSTLACKNLTHIALRIAVFFLMFLAYVDLTLKYTWGCDPQEVYPCCLIKKPE